MSVSVIIPVFNSEKTILKAVSSCLLQIEVSQIIIVNDGSEDDTKSICDKLSKEEDMIYFHSYDNNVGPAHARNIALSLVNQPYYTFLDSDDYYLPNRFKKAIETLENNKSIDGVYGIIKNVFSENIYTDKLNQPELLLLSQTLAPEDLFESVVTESLYYFAFQSLVLRSQIIKNIEGFDTSFKYGSDIDFIYTLTLNCKLISDGTSTPFYIRNVNGNNFTLSEDCDLAHVRNPIVHKWYNRMLKESWSKKTNRGIFRRYISTLDQERPSKKLHRYIFKSFIICKKLISDPTFINKII